MENEFTISFATLIGILASAHTYYQKIDEKLGLDENERWESTVRDKLEEFICSIPSREFKIIGK